MLVENPRARRVVVYTWNFHPDLIESARQHGAHGYLSKTLPARELVAALEAVHAGEIVISDVPPRARSAIGLDWPGRGEGLTDRESEILALITQGKSNAEVAALTYLSPNTVKSYIRTIYRKIDVGQPHPGRAVGGRNTASRPTTTASTTGRAGRDHRNERAADRTADEIAVANGDTDGPRKLNQTIARSVPTVKGDAAQRVFGINCSELNWAIIDSGIDRTTRRCIPPPNRSAVVVTLLSCQRFES